MEELFTTILEQSIVLATMAFAWRLAEARANAERKKADEIGERFIEWLIDDAKYTRNRDFAQD